MANFNTKGYDLDSKRAAWSQGDKRITVSAIAQIVAGTNDGDTFILARNIPLDAIVSRVLLPKGSAGITGGTDYDLGFYKSDGDSLGAVLGGGNTVKNAWDASAALTGLDIQTSDATLTIGELLSLNPDEAYQGGVHIVLTCNTAGTAAQDLDFDIELIMAG